MALGGHGIDEGWTQAVGWLVVVDHHAVGFLETLGKGGAWGGVSRVSGGGELLEGWKVEEGGDGVRTDIFT